MQKIENYNEYMNAIGERGDVFVFRGEPKSDFIIIPSGLRSNHINIADNQMFRFVDEMKESFGFDELTCIEIGQHFSLPTRMLDFSYNYNVALFFACKEMRGRYEDCDGKVYIFNKSKYERIVKQFNGEILQETKNNKLLYEWLTQYVEHKNTDSTNMGFDLPIFVDATRSFDRLSMQSGLFMLWGSNENCFEEIMKSHHIDLNEFIDTIIIPASAKPKILEELKTKHISEDTLFMNIAKVRNLVMDIKGK